VRVSPNMPSARRRSAGMTPTPSASGRGGMSNYSYRSTRPTARLGTKMFNRPPDVSLSNEAQRLKRPDVMASDRASWESRSMSTDGCESEESTECPTCGRSDFSSRSYMKSHHKQAHGESIAGVKVACDWCGDEMRRPRCDIERAENLFCDEECYGKWKSEERTGEDNPNWIQKVTVSCAMCGDSMRVRPNYAEKYNRHYCSEKCLGEWRSENWTGESHPNGGKRVELECEWCGDVFEVPEYRTESDPCRFCSRGCALKWDATRTGEDAPNWRGGGSDDYGTGWNDSKKEAVRKRDDYSCQGCGLSNQQHIERNGRQLDIHHIIPARMFDNAEKRNAMENLVTLCRDCHTAWEEMAPLRPEGRRS